MLVIFTGFFIDTISFPIAAMMNKPGTNNLQKRWNLNNAHTKMQTSRVYSINVECHCKSWFSNNSNMGGSIANLQ